MKFSIKAGLALAVSAAFIATSAPVFAASQVDFSGFYRAKFHTYGNTGFNGGPDKFTTDKHSDTWFANRFRLNMNIQATDEVSVHARWQGPNDKKWGQEQGDVNVKYAFGQVKQDWGTIQVGRLNDQDGIGHAGLARLGWEPFTVDGDEDHFRPFDTGDGADGINYFNTWDNGFTLQAAYLKLKDSERNFGGITKEYRNGSLFSTTSDVGNGNDRDMDRFQVEGLYQWDTGGASLAVMYDRDATGDYSTMTEYNNSDPTVYKDRGFSTTSIWYINPAFMQSWGAFSTHAEAMFGFGKFNNLTDAMKADGKDDKISGQGFYLDFDYNYGPGRVNLAGWWASGTDWKDADKGKVKGLPDGIGKNFAPLLVLYETDLLKTVNRNQGGLGLSDAYKPYKANHWAIDLNGQHAFTDEITARWAIAYAALNKATWGETVNGKLYEQDKDLGWEIDLGATVNILDNLDFYTGFGYLFAGDALKSTPDGNGKQTDGDDAYAWINTLYFNF